MVKINMNALRGLLFCFRKDDVESDHEENQNSDMTEDSRLLLQNMPDPVKKLFVEHLGIESRLIFRKTCHQFRNLVDNGKIKINQLTIRFYVNFIEISTDDGFKVQFNNKWKVESCMVKHNEESIFLEDQMFIDCAETELKLILQNEKLQINTLSIDEQSYELNIRLFYQMLERALFVTKKQLKVENVIYKYSGTYYSPSTIFSRFDPRFIKCFKLDSHHKRCEFYGYKLLDLEQWRSCKRFSSNLLFQTHLLLNRFEHFSFAKFVVADSPSIEQVMSIKEKLLLKNPKLNQIKIKAKMKRDDFIEINRQLHTYNIAGMSNPSWAHFQYPNSPNKRLSLCVTDKLIWFKGPCYVEEVEDSEDEDSSDEENEPEIRVFPYPFDISDNEDSDNF